MSLYKKALHILEAEAKQAESKKSVTSEKKQPGDNKQNILISSGELEKLKKKLNKPVKNENGSTQKKKKFNPSYNKILDEALSPIRIQESEFTRIFADQKNIRSSNIEILDTLLSNFNLFYLNVLYLNNFDDAVKYIFSKVNEYFFLDKIIVVYNGKIFPQEFSDNAIIDLIKYIKSCYYSLAKNQDIINLQKHLTIKKPYYFYPLPSKEEAMNFCIFCIHKTKNLSLNPYYFDIIKVIINFFSQYLLNLYNLPDNYGENITGILNKNPEPSQYRNIYLNLQSTLKDFINHGIEEIRLFKILNYPNIFSLIPPESSLEFNKIFMDLLRINGFIKITDKIILYPSKVDPLINLEEILKQALGEFGILKTPIISEKVLPIIDFQQIYKEILFRL